MQIKHVTVIIVISFCLNISFAGSKDSFKGMPYFAGGTFVFHKRTASNLFESVKKRQDFERPNLIQGGVCFGKRYYAASWLRFQLMCMFNIGKKDEDTTYYTKKYSYRHLGFDLDIHFVLQESRTINSYVFLGGGFNYMHAFMETVPDEFTGLDAKRWCASAHGGAGFDVRLGPKLGLNFEYAFRFWQPVNYLDKTDLPLSAVEYKETFFSHLGQVKLLFNLDGS